jgi:hypothetical protein
MDETLPPQCVAAAEPTALRCIAGIWERTEWRIAVKLMLSPTMPVHTNHLSIMDNEAIVVERIRDNAGNG